MLKFTQSNHSDEGSVPLNTPKHMASIWLDYQVPAKLLVEGLVVGIGARYRGDSYADPDNTIINPAHTLLDATVAYHGQSWQANLNVSNLTDKDYAASYAWGYYRGPRRTVKLSLSYNF